MSSNTSQSIPEIKVEALNISTGSASNNHGDLSGREYENQHPISAIEGLQSVLDSKANTGDIPGALSGFENDMQFIGILHTHDAANSNAISYNDLTDTPFIPTKFSELENDIGAGFSSAGSITEQTFIDVFEDVITFDYATSIYKKIISTDTELTFDTTALRNINSIATFELWLTINSDALITNMPGLIWVGTQPDLSLAGTYVITLRYDNTYIYANHAYTIRTS